MISVLVGPLTAAVVALPTGTDVDYQPGGAIEPSAGVGIVVRDRTEPPAAGRYIICYANAFQTQPDEKAVLMIEYPTADFRETCTAHSATHAVELRDRELTPSGVHAWC